MEPHSEQCRAQIVILGLDIRRNAARKRRELKEAAIAGWGRRNPLRLLRELKVQTEVAPVGIFLYVKNQIFLVKDLNY